MCIRDSHITLVKSLAGNPAGAISDKRPHFIDQMLLGGILESLGNPPLRVILWDGREIGSTVKWETATPPIRLLIRDRAALLRLIADPEINFGEMFVSGRIEVQGDLAEFLEMIYRALPRSRPPGLREKILTMLIGKQGNSRRSAARNIYHHYDIGNDLSLIHI